MFDFITQLVDNSLLACEVRTPGVIVTRVATLIEILMMQIKRDLFGTHRIMRHLGQTFVDVLIVLIALLLGLLTDLSFDGWFE